MRQKLVAKLVLINTSTSIQPLRNIEEATHDVLELESKSDGLIVDILNLL